MSAPDALIAELRKEALDLQRESPSPSVSIALFRGEELLWSEAIGLADVESGREATPDTQYAIASITKTFVGASLLRLRDEGKVALDDPLGKYVPEAAGFDGVTIRRALSHSSGLQREVPGDIWEELAFPDREGLLASVADAEQVLGPAERWHYSNLAYSLLGQVIGAVSDLEPTDFITEHFLVPQGLERTTWAPEGDAATGYFVERFADVAVPEPFVLKGAVAPAGALWSTTGDLARWASWLMEQDEMHIVQFMADPESWRLAWGLGVELDRRGDRIFGGHLGAAIGHASYLMYARRDKIGTVVLTNTENPSLAWDWVAVTEKAVDGLAGEDEPWRPGEPIPDELVDVLGSWWGEGVEWRLEWRSGKLEARLPGRSLPVPTTFEREAEDRYRTATGREKGELLRIVRDDDGRPVKLYWATYPFTRTARPLGH